MKNTKPIDCNYMESEINSTGLSVDRKTIPSGSDRNPREAMQGSYISTECQIFSSL